MPKIKAPAVDVPQVKEEAERLLAKIGAAQRKITGLEAEMNERLARVKETWEEKARPYNEEIERTFETLHYWAEAHRAELLDGKSKTARLATGEISWRLSPPSVTVRGKEKVIAALKALGLGKFIRQKEDVNKEAILAAPDEVRGVKGITVGQREEFVAKPFESQIERAKAVKTAKRRGGS